MTTPWNSGAVPVGEPVQQLALQAATPVAGFALGASGFETIATWTAPNDGQLHRALIMGGMQVTSATTGGQVTLKVASPGDSAVATYVIFGISQAGGDYAFPVFFLPVKAGTSVTVLQATGISAGAALVWTEIWGS